MLVKVYNNDINSALKRLKRLMYDENILRDYMSHTRYEKPSVKRRRKRKESLIRQRKELRNRMKFEGY